MADLGDILTNEQLDTLKRESLEIIRKTNNIPNILSGSKDNRFSRAFGSDRRFRDFIIEERRKLSSNPVFVRRKLTDNNRRSLKDGIIDFYKKASPGEKTKLQKADA